MTLIYTYKNGDMIFYERMEVGAGGFAHITNENYDVIVSEQFGHTRSVAIERVREEYRRLRTKTI